MLVVVIEIVGIGIVIVIVDVHGGVVVTARGDNLDAAVAQRGIHRGELLVRNIDILQGDLNLVLGYRSPVRAVAHELCNVGFQPSTRALSLFWHRFSLHSPQDSIL